jgi:phage baseplate assembly protein W
VPYYKGITFPFHFNPSGSTATTELTPDDLSLIVQSLRQIWFVAYREVPMEPQAGSSVRAHMFESIDDITDMAILKHEMMKSAREQEKRVVINDIRFRDHPTEEGAVVVEVDVKVVKFRKDATLEIVYVRT